MENKWIYGIIGVILLLGVIAFYNPLGEGSIISNDKVEFSDGKYHWITTLNIDGTKESTTYTLVGSKKTTPTGQVIEPQKPVTLTFERGNNLCNYKVVENFKSFSFFSDDLMYHTLQNPYREILYYVSSPDTTPGFEGFSAYDRETFHFTHSNGKGELSLQNMGTLQGRNDCPSPNDVAIVYVNNNWYVKKLSSLNAKESCAIWFTHEECIKDDVETSPFLDNFVGNNFGAQQATFIGRMRDNALGTAVVTISADADMFESVTYTPTTVANPKITNIDSASDFKRGKDNAVNIKIRNIGDDGMVSITPVREDGTSFKPSAQQINIDSNSEGIATFLVTPLIEKSFKMCFTACGTGNQVTSGECDTFCKDIDVKDSVDLWCGDGVCSPQRGESNNCQLDCGSSGIINPQTNGETGDFNIWIFLVSLIVAVIVTGFFYRYGGKFMWDIDTDYKPVNGMFRLFAIVVTLAIFFLAMVLMAKLITGFLGLFTLKSAAARLLV